MEIRVLFSEDPAFVLTRAGACLASEPVLNNLVLTILHARVAHPEPGHYWIAMDGEDAVGVGIQSPLTFPATLTPMKAPAARALAAAIVEAGVALPGISGEAAATASFAGHWSERSKLPAIPFEQNRLYELGEIGKVPLVEGSLRRADGKDRGVMILWTRGFQEEIGEPGGDTELRVDRGMAAGELWVWDRDGQAVSMAVRRQPMHGVVRLSGVYTPPELRRHGYAEACVYFLSKQLKEAGYRCSLYTDLGNPTSNSIYRRIGYRAVAEILRYRFG